MNMIELPAVGRGKFLSIRSLGPFILGAEEVRSHEIILAPTRNGMVCEDIEPNAVAPTGHNNQAEA